MSSARSAQIFGGKENKNNMKRQMGYEQPMTLFSYEHSRLPLGTWPLIVLCHHHLASLTEMPQYIKIGTPF